MGTGPPTPYEPQHMNNRLCPYTSSLVTSLDANREHIIPDALGGPNSFAVRADRTMNERYGATVDSRLIHAPIVSLLAAKLGVTSRSGPTASRAKGSLVEDGSPVDVEFSSSSVSFRIRKPVVHDDQTGELAAVRGFGNDAQKQLARIARDLSKKGQTVIAGAASVSTSQVRVRLTHNRLHVEQGLGKIAYLATVWTLGDSFIATAAAAKYRAYIGAEPLNEAMATTGLCAMPISKLRDAMPNLSEAYHLILCSQRGNRVTTLVRLFNSDLLSAVYVVNVAELPKSAPTTRIIAVHSVKRTLEQGDSKYAV